MVAFKVCFVFFDNLFVTTCYKAIDMIIDLLNTNFEISIVNLGFRFNVS